MDRHLVTVEVGVEARADERVETDGSTINEHRLEGLNRETVEGRSTVKEHRVIGDDFLDDVEDFRIITVDHLIRGLMSGDFPSFDEDRRDEGAEELDRHFTR